MQHNCQQLLCFFNPFDNLTFWCLLPEAAAKFANLTCAVLDMVIAIHNCTMFLRHPHDLAAYVSSRRQVSQMKGKHADIALLIRLWNARTGLVSPNFPRCRLQLESPAPAPAQDHRLKVATAYGLFNLAPICHS